MSDVKLLTVGDAGEDGLGDYARNVTATIRALAERLAMAEKRGVGAWSRTDAPGLDPIHRSPPEDDPPPRAALLSVHPPAKPEE